LPKQNAAVRRPPTQDVGFSILRRRGFESGERHRLSTPTKPTISDPILRIGRPNARWSLDFVSDQFAGGRRFRILNIVDDMTKVYLDAIADTSISGRL
jgi:putative transposase